MLYRHRLEDNDTLWANYIQDPHEEYNTTMNHTNVRVPRGDDPKEYLRGLWEMIGSTVDFVQTGDVYAPVLLELGIPARYSAVQGDEILTFVIKEGGRADDDERYAEYDKFEGVAPTGWEDVFPPRSVA